jgi:hypothetical protein
MKNCESFEFFEPLFAIPTRPRCAKRRRGWISSSNGSVQRKWLYAEIQHHARKRNGEQSNAPPKKDSPPEPEPVLSPVCTRKSGTTLCETNRINERHVLKLQETRVEDTCGISHRHSTLAWCRKSEQYRIAKTRRGMHTLHSQRNKIPACFRRFLRGA